MFVIFYRNVKTVNVENKLLTYNKDVLSLEWLYKKRTEK